MSKGMEGYMILEDDVKESLIALAQKYDLKDLVLFGSRARGDCWERSDIDIAAHFNSRKDHLCFCDDVERIRTLLMFDVVNLNSDSIDLDLRENIKKEGITLYEKV